METPAGPRGRVASVAGGGSASAPWSSRPAPRHSRSAGPFALRPFVDAAHAAGSAGEVSVAFVLDFGGSSGDQVVGCVTVPASDTRYDALGRLRPEGGPDPADLRVERPALLDQRHPQQRVWPDRRRWLHLLGVLHRRSRWLDLRVLGGERHGRDRRRRGLALRESGVRQPARPRAAHRAAVQLDLRLVDHPRPSRPPPPSRPAGPDGGGGGGGGGRRSGTSCAHDHTPTPRTGLAPSPPVDRPPRSRPPPRHRRHPPTTTSTLPSGTATSSPTTSATTDPAVGLANHTARVPGGPGPGPGPMIIGGLLIAALAVAGYTRWRKRPRTP